MNGKLRLAHIASGADAPYIARRKRQLMAMRRRESLFVQNHRKSALSNSAAEAYCPVKYVENNECREAMSVGAR